MAVKASNNRTSCVCTNECKHNKECPWTLYQLHSPEHGLDLFVVRTLEFAGRACLSRSDDLIILQFVVRVPSDTPH